MSVPVRNVGDEASVPVRVRYAITDADNQTQVVATDTLAAIAAREEATSRAELAPPVFQGATCSP